MMYNSLKCFCTSVDFHGHVGKLNIKKFNPIKRVNETRAFHLKLLKELKKKFAGLLQSICQSLEESNDNICMNKK